ncbi:hypothetical protein O181_025400 [Austropuccinia psidii MF-1]|uniref:Uncharacterized protein n=1 Tax=Austropuccinia psidii MF-1 TaxID=1389203 RepID=A0A9Q3CMJ9_9BASI|nr:hypothetical protein [Austropuccinia psidii MF-1]
MSFPQPPERNPSYDELLHNLFSNNIDPTPSSSYQNDPPSTLLLDPFCIPNSMNEVKESYDIFSFLHSTQTAQTPDIIQNHQAPPSHQIK